MKATYATISLTAMIAALTRTQQKVFMDTPAPAITIRVTPDKTASSGQAATTASERLTAARAGAGSGADRLRLHRRLRLHCRPHRRRCRRLRLFRRSGRLGRVGRLRPLRRLRRCLRLRCCLRRLRCRRLRPGRPYALRWARRPREVFA